MDIQNTIITTAEKMFLRYGFKRVTMDDMARELGISKKTIYQYFKDKNEIVCRATEQHLARENSTIMALEEESENVIEFLVKTSKQLRKHLKVIHPPAMEELRKYYPQGWQIFMRYKQEVFLQSFCKTLEKGIQEGYFLPELNPELLSIMRMEQVQMAFDEQLFPCSRYEAAEVQGQLLAHFVSGILTDKGRELMKHYSNSTPNNEIIF